MAYTAAAWLGFGEALAAVAGALTGLLFVAVSMKSELLARSRSLASRAAQTLVLFMISVLTGLLLVAPQPRLALGSELLALAAISGLILVVLDRRPAATPGKRAMTPRIRAAPRATGWRATSSSTRPTWSPRCSSPWPR